MNRKLRVLTYRWHVGQMWEFAKLPVELTFLRGLNSLADHWDTSCRPLPANARFRDLDEGIDLRNYDLAVCHFDEFALRPELSNGQLTADWGAPFRFLMENFEGPKLAWCYGVPIFHGAYDVGREYSAPDLGQTIESCRRELVEYVGDTVVNVNSHQAWHEWGFRNARVIWQGFDPLDYPPCDPSASGILSVLGALRQRPYYRGLDLYEEVLRRLSVPAFLLGDDVGRQVFRRELPTELFDDADDAGRAHHRAYVDVLRSHGVFFNPTRTSPMPCTRGEALMCGLAMVTTSWHDADLFLENGTNGFVSDDPEELVGILTELANDADLRRRIGCRGRETALDLFHLDRHLSEWHEVLVEVLDSFSTGRSLPVPRRPPEPRRRRHPGRQPRRSRSGFGSAAARALLVSGEGGGTFRYRVQHAAEALQLRGFETEIVEWEDRYPAVENRLRHGGFDRLLCHRVPDGPLLARLVATCDAEGIEALYDLDDLVFATPFVDHLVQCGWCDRPSAERRTARYRSALLRFRRVSCSTAPLAAWVAAEGEASVHVVRNRLSEEWLRRADRARADRFEDARRCRERVVVGYAAGSPTHQRDLAVVVPALCRLLERHRHVEFRLLGEGALPPPLVELGDRVARIPRVEWRDYPPILADLDVNLAPLGPGPFAEAKSEIKFLEAATVEVVTVASPTLPFREAIEHGESGLLAETADDWVDCLDRLVTDAGLRARLAERARLRVERSSRLESTADELIACWSGRWPTGPDVPVEGRRLRGLEIGASEVPSNGDGRPPRLEPATPTR